MRQLPEEKVPRLDSDGEKYRELQLVYQMPKQDLDERHCHHLVRNCTCCSCSCSCSRFCSMLFWHIAVVTVALFYVVNVVVVAAAAAAAAIIAGVADGFLKSLNDFVQIAELEQLIAIKFLPHRRPTAA